MHTIVDETVVDKVLDRKKPAGTGFLLIQLTVRLAVC